MFDYRHKPFNRIPLPQRPQWLSESVKFIREFDPLASRMYERSFERSRSHERNRNYNNFDPDSKEFVRENRNYRNESRNYGRDIRGYDIEKERSSYRNKTNKHDDDNEHDRKRLRLDSDGKYGSKNNTTAKDDDKRTDLKDSLEELSDEDMDWEGGGKSNVTNQNVEERQSQSNSPILSNPPNPSNKTDINTIEDIINEPGRFNRPPRIVIILRGPPGSGKTFLAKLIKDKEVRFIKCFSFF